MKFASDRLKDLRESNGYTQEYVAEQSGLSRQQYMQLEKGKHTPRLETINSLAKVFNVPGKFFIEE